MSTSSSPNTVNMRQTSGLRGSTAKSSQPRMKAIQFLQFLPRLASAHPIPVIVFVSLLASLSSVGLLEIILSDSSDVSTTLSRSSWPSLLETSERLQATSSTAWKWQKVGLEHDPTLSDAHQIVLLTLTFPNASSSTATDIPDIPNLDFPVISLPPTPRPFTVNDTQDTTVVLSLAYKNAPELLEALQEIPVRKYTDSRMKTQLQYEREERAWVMKAAQPQKWSITGLSRAGVVSWAKNSWFDFVGLLRTAETFDIVIMALVYISMHFTFASLFLSMRRLGSRFSLAIGVLVSSSFAFVFGLSVATKIFHVSITTRLLSEGLPFLVVVIGFENGILLTQSVLSHALKHNKPGGSSSMVQHAIEATIKERSFQIIRNYAVEIFFLVAGSFSGIEGGFQSFCILASWILLFDCILLFLLYTPILCVRLELCRIKRHIEIRNSLEDDGISHRVAESVAQSDEPSPPAILGRPIKRIRETPRVKIFMVSCFVLANIINLFYIIPFKRSSRLSGGSPSWIYGRGLGVIQPPPIDPFKVASNGLASILEEAKLNLQATMVTVLVPINYELEGSPVYNNPLRNTGTEGISRFSTSHNRTGENSAVISLLRSFEDPALDKWIIVALCISIAFNGFLFNAARWGIKDDLTNIPEPINPDELAQAQRANAYSDNTSFLPGEDRTQTLSPATSVPLPTPTDTDEEAENTREGQGPIAALDSLNILHTDQEMDVILQGKRAHELTDEEIVSLALRGRIAGHALEKTLNLDFNRAVIVRRAIISRTRLTRDLTRSLERSKLPYENYNWSQVFGACCENVVGYMPIPVGVAGPLVIDGRSYFIPMATTEGVLVASASRGAKAINAGGGAVTVLTADGMTRGPCVSFGTLERAGAAKLWLDSEEGQFTMKGAFNSTSGFARLESMNCALAGTTLFIRFKTTTGDAMGMNMISKGVEHALNVMKATGFADMDIITLSGNYCSDKKPAAINWIEGRGKSVVAEAIVPGEVVKSVLKTTVDALVDVFINKNMIGSAMAGSIGGFNAQAANLVAAIFLATGQDPAQVVESANCITIMKNVRGALQITVSMPSIEVGTLGGGTILEPQSAMLDLLGVRGPHPTQPGANARQLARIIAAATMAGELSLCSALAAGHLVQAHMQHNRSTAPTRSHTPA